MPDAPRWPEVRGRERSGDRMRLALRLPGDLVWFEGHFPGCPILPGVVQVHWAAGFFLAEYGLDRAFAHMEAIKFKQLLLPGREVSLQLDYDPERDRLAFRYATPCAEYSSGRIYWRPA